MALLLLAVLAIPVFGAQPNSERHWVGAEWRGGAPLPDAPTPLLSPRSRRVRGTAPAAAPGTDAELATVFDEDALISLRRAARRQRRSSAAAAAAAAPWRRWAAHVADAVADAREACQWRSGAAVIGAPQRDAAPFDPDLAELLSKLQSVAYCPDLEAVHNWTCVRCGGVPGFITDTAHFDKLWDLSGYAGYLPSLGAKVLVFRGTDSSSWYNWAENMRAWRTDATYPLPGAPRSLRIHSGFQRLWNSSSMASTFTAAYARLAAAHPRGPTYILGHSMGGALAHLAALDLRAAFDPPDLRVYTFGSPRVGNADFAEFFDTHVAASWRFTHARDMVPSLPPTLMGFHHTAREVWLVDVDPAKGGGPQERVVVCDDTGEDPSCHLSVCHLGLCTSVADHYVYLGANMFAGDC